MATHAELVNELPLLERMSTSERMRLAKKRRSQQLRKYAQLEQKREKELLQQQQQQHQEDDYFSNKLQTIEPATQKTKTKKVSFVPSVMLLEAGNRNDVNEVKRLVNSGICPDLRNDDGLTVLHQCCIENWKDLLILLLDSGANPDVVDNELWTPLHTAAACGRVSICQVLIDRGADLLAVNADGNMAYDICQDQETLDFVEQQMSAKGITQDEINKRRLQRETRFLEDLKSHLNEGGDVNVRGSKGESLLHVAASNGYLSVARLLVENGANVNATDEDLWQPVHCAACWDQLHMMEMLVENGANLDAKTKNGETPLDICEDLEMRQRILHLQKDRKLKAAVKSQNLAFSKTGGISSTRRGSITNTRSASVRRSSTSQKKSLAMKEAKEEALRLKTLSKKIDGPIKEEKMKIKPNSMFKIKAKASSSAKSATPKNYSVGDNFSDVLLPNASDSEATTPEKTSTVRYRKSDPNQPGEGQKFIKNSPYKKQRRRQDDSSDSKQQCCSIV